MGRSSFREMGRWDDRFSEMGRFVSMWMGRWDDRFSEMGRFVFMWRDDGTIGSKRGRDDGTILTQERCSMGRWDDPLAEGMGRSFG